MGVLRPLESFAPPPPLPRFMSSHAAVLCLLVALVACGCARTTHLGSFDAADLTVLGVTVFQGEGAIITREIELPLELDPGDYHLTVRNITRQMLEEGVTAAAPKGVFVSDLATKRVKTLVSADPERTRVEGALRAINAEILQLQRRQQATSLEIERVDEFLRSLRAGRICASSAQPSSDCHEAALRPEDVEAATKFHSSEIERLLQIRAQIDEELFQARARGHSIQLELQLLADDSSSSAFLRDTFELSVRFTVLSSLSPLPTATASTATRQNPTLSISYSVRGAGWQAAYTADATGDLTSEGTKLELQYDALVNNQCGEDWIDAVLTLSTVRPSQDLSPPEMTRQEASLAEPWQAHSDRHFKNIRLQSAAFYAPIAEERRKRSGQPEILELGGEFAGIFGASGDSAPSDGLMDDEWMLSVTDTAVEDSTGISALFKVARTATILSSAVGAAHQPHRVPIGKVELGNVELSHVAMPRHAGGSVFVRSRSTNQSPYHLLPGPVLLLVNGQLVGHSSRLLTRSVRPGASIELYLGVDHSITISSTQRVTQNETRLFMSGQLSSTYYTASVMNNKDRPVTVDLFSVVPFSSDEKIVVTITSPTICDKDKKTSNGSGEPTQCAELTSSNWVRLPVTIPKHSSSGELKFGYRIQYPRDRVVRLH